MTQLTKIISKVLGITESSITDTTSPDNTPTWDSFNSLMLVSELENEFKVKFTMQEVSLIRSVKDIKALLQKYHVSH